MCEKPITACADTTAFSRRFGLTFMREEPEYGMKLYGALVSGDSFVVWASLPKGFTEVLSWRDGFLRRVWTNLEHRVICTYCEHDVHLAFYDSEDAYFDATERAAAFYNFLEFG